MLMYVNPCHWYANHHLTPTIQLVRGGNVQPLEETPWFNSETERGKKRDMRLFLKILISDWRASHSLKGKIKVAISFFYYIFFYFHTVQEKGKMCQPVLKWAHITWYKLSSDLVTFNIWVALKIRAKPTIRKWFKIVVPPPPTHLFVL